MSALASEQPQQAGLFAAKESQRNEREAAFSAEGIKSRRKRYVACDDVVVVLTGLEPVTPSM